MEKNCCHASAMPFCWLIVSTVVARRIHCAGLPCLSYRLARIRYLASLYRVGRLLVFRQAGFRLFSGRMRLGFFLSSQRFSLIPTSLIPGRSVSGRRWVILKRYSPAFPMRTIPARSVDWYSPPQPSPDQTPVLSASLISNVSFLKFCVSGLS